MATQKNASFFSIPVFASASEFRVNTAHFTKEDLSLYIQNMELIEALKREKSKLREEREEQIRFTRELLQLEFRPSTALTARGCAPSPTATLIENLEDLRVCDTAPTEIETEIPTSTSKAITPVTPTSDQTLTKRTISVRRSSEEDETYFSDASSERQCTPNSQFKKPRMLFEAPAKRSPNSNSSSDSEESGVFPTSSTATTPTPTPTPLPPTAMPARPRLKLKREKSKRSTRSRIISLLLRRDPIIQRGGGDDVDCRKTASNLNVSKDQPDFPEEIKRVYGRLAIRSVRSIMKNPFGMKKTKDVDGLDKAMRYMTL